MTVNNIGTVAATGFTVTDELPAALTLGSISGDGFTCDSAAVRCVYPGTLAAGGSATLTLSTTLASSFTGTSVTNVTVVGPDDATPENNRATATTPVNQEPAPPLPFTGSNTYQMLLGALTLLSVGAALVLAGRRRKLWTV
jgi:LPXTG-motif cell wall-anchored protein